MLEFVETLTLAPWEVADRDYATLREHGLGDAQIAQVVLGCAHFNYLNRMADGLGIRYEYPKQLEQYVAGQGAARRDAFAQRKVPLPRARAARSERPSAPESTRRPPSGDVLSVIAGVNQDAADGVALWREYHFRGTERFPQDLRVLIARRCAELEFAQDPAVTDVPGLDLPQTGQEDAASAAVTAQVLEHARLLIQSPASCRRTHIDLLRAVGLDDRDVLQLTMLVAYLAFERRAHAGLAIVPPNAS